MINDFLFELGCEELPSLAVLSLSNAMAASTAAALDNAKITYKSMENFATPRRLGLLLKGLASEAPSMQVSRRGPAKLAAYDRDGNPTKALLGFAKSCGVEVADLTISTTDKGEWLVYEALVPGAKTAEILPSLIKQVLTTLAIAKPMRWGEGECLFVRPVHWAVMLFNNSLLPLEIFGVQANRYTYGHRFHAPEAISINNPAHYESLLQDACVVADFGKRRSLIVKQIEALAKKYDANAIMPDALIDEVTSIVEWPEALVATFDRDFLQVPSEALIASMQVHQKCFALQDKAGKLLPNFVAVSNIRSLKPLQVIEGNEKVMRARLSDAAFFFNQDKKKPLSHHIAATAKVIFQVRLGTLLDKATRVQSLMQSLANTLQLNSQHATRAAQLCKCDLLTGMVGEFPELQGLMGYYYALHDGEAPDVALALKEQYLPRFAGDDLPGSSLGGALSMAERIDTLVGIFAIGLKPSGDKDPFKLRRHALALVRLLIVNPANLDLPQLIKEAAANYGTEFAKTDALIAELHPFILERLQSYYQGQGITNEFVHAVRAKQANCLYDFDKRIKALVQFVNLPEAGSLSAACKRVNNLLSHAQLAMQQTPVVNRALLCEEAEKILFDTIETTQNLVAPLYATGDYVSILFKLADLHKPIDNFFDKVMVMVEDNDLKTNRLFLLFRLQTLLQNVADISLLGI